MANYINKYNNLTDWLNDTEKQFPNVSYLVEEDEINWGKNGPFRLKLFYENGDEYTLEMGEGYNQNYIATTDVKRKISSSSDPHHYSHIVKAIIGDYETNLGSYVGQSSVSESDVFAYCYKLTEVVFGKRLKTIGNKCFYYCSKLTGDIILSNSIEKVGSDAFYTNTSDIEAKRKLFVPKNLTTYIQESNSDTGKYSECFGTSYNKTGFASIIVDPENPKYDSRDNCNCLINSTSNMLLMAANYNAFLPSTVTSIGKNAFKNSDITSVDLSNVTNISESSFQNCENLETVTIGSKITSLPKLCFFETIWKNIVIPSQVSSIYEMNGDGVHNSSALPYNFYIETIVVDPENTVYDSRDNCNAIIKTDENKIIYNCNNTTLPSTVTKIGYYVFSKNNRSVGFTNFNFENITHIQAGAFSQQILEEISLPKIVVTSGFDYCRQLTKIDFGENVTNISGLYNVSLLKKVICRADVPPTLSSYAFYNSGLTDIYVPDEAVEDYKAATNWSSYANKIKPLSEYVEE